MGRRRIDLRYLAERVLELKDTDCWLGLIRCPWDVLCPIGRKECPAPIAMYGELGMIALCPYERGR